MPYRSMLKNLSCQAGGRKGAITFEPSRGGIGTRLKTISKRFIKTIIENKLIKIILLRGKKRNIKPKNKAVIKFPSGPAIATLADPYFLSLKL